MYYVVIDVSRRREWNMKSLRKSMLAAIVFVAAVASMTLAQGPVQKRVNYAINVPFAVKMGDYMLPAGKYVLYQINGNDLNLFALYQNDMTHSPVAMIRTTRIEYQSSDEHPSKASMMLDIDESSSDAHPVLRGWNIPGDDGWEVISVVPKNRSVLTRIR
jgi:hypothetical protein